MGAGVPLELGELLSAGDDATRTEAWDHLIAKHSPLMLRVARAMGGGHDAVMDRYAVILDKLRQDDFRRLRVYVADSGATFTTWLVVVARRLCLDHYRERYGRTRPSTNPDRDASLHAVRQNLADLLPNEVEADDLPDNATRSADADIVAANLDASLRAAMAALPARDRFLLALRFEDELSAARIAGILGYATPFHVYRHLNAVFVRLRGALEARGIQDSDG